MRARRQHLPGVSAALNTHRIISSMYRGVPMVVSGAATVLLLPHPLDCCFSVAAFTPSLLAPLVYNIPDKTERYVHVEPLAYNIRVYGMYLYHFACFSCFGTCFVGGSEPFRTLPSQGQGGRRYITAGGPSTTRGACARRLQLKKMALYPGTCSALRKPSQEIKKI